MGNKELFDDVIRNSLELELNYDVSGAVRGETDNWDSIGHMVLIDNVENTFGIMMDPADILNFKSYDSGVEILAKYGVIV